MGVHVTPIAYGWLIGLWGVLLFIVSAPLVLVADQSVKKTKIAAQIVGVDGIGVAGAGIWCACHAPELDESWSVAIIAGCVGGIVYALRALFYWTTVATTASSAHSFQAATASTSTLTRIKGALNIMSWTNTQTTIAVSAAIFLTAATIKIIDAHTVQSNAGNDSSRTSPFRDRTKYLSPFTAVHFDTNDMNKVVVAYDGSEYELAAIDDLPATEIRDFCRRQYGQPPLGEGWAEKRFAEDLVVVLADMKHAVSSDNTVKLTLVDPQNGQRKTVAHAPMTGNNRTAIVQDRTLANSNLFQLLQKK